MVDCSADFLVSKRNKGVQWSLNAAVELQKSQGLQHTNSTCNRSVGAEHFGVLTGNNIYMYICTVCQLNFDFSTWLYYTKCPFEACLIYFSIIIQIIEKDILSILSNTSIVCEDFFSNYSEVYHGDFSANTALGYFLFTDICIMLSWS